MIITGTFEAFKEMMDHDSTAAHSTVFYILRQNGRVDSILVDHHFEWKFTANFDPDVATVRRFFPAAIEVDNWIL